MSVEVRASCWHCGAPAPSNGRACPKCGECGQLIAIEVVDEPLETTDGLDADLSNSEGVRSEYSVRTDGVTESSRTTDYGPVPSVRVQGQRAIPRTRPDMEREEIAAGRAVAAQLLQRDGERYSVRKGPNPPDIYLEAESARWPGRPRRIEVEVRHCDDAAIEILGKCSCFDERQDLDQIVRNVAHAVGAKSVGVDVTPGTFLALIAPYPLRPAIAPSLAKAVTVSPPKYTEVWLCPLGGPAFRIA